MKFHKIAIILGLIISVQGDQPIKCPKTGGDVNYVGKTWTFHVTPEVERVNLYQAREVCSHQMPNKVQIMAENYQFSFGKQNIWKVRIVDDQSVLAVKCPGVGHDCAFERQDAFAIRGAWDILYQQSLLINLDNNLRFIANFQYTLMPNQEDKIAANDAWRTPFNVLAGIRDHDFDRFNQNCDKTMIGFVQTRGDNQGLTNVGIQCFYGVLDEQREVVESQKVAEQTEEAKTPKEAAKQGPKDLFKIAAESQGKEVGKPQGKPAPPKSNSEKKTSKPAAPQKKSALASVADFAGATDPSDADVDVGDDMLQIRSSMKMKLSQQQVDYTEAKLHDKGHYNYFSKQRLSKLHPHKPSPQFDELIMTINNNPSSSWRANECYLQKSHKAYPGEKSCQKHSKSGRELVQLGGYDDDDEDVVQEPKDLVQVEKEHSKASEGDAASSESAQGFVESWSTKYQSASQIPNGEVPISFDLRNVMGTDYTSEVRDQAQCGSCYAMSFVQVVESRLKYKGLTVPSLSPQHLLQCNFMTEGCTGGWAVMNGFFAESGGLVAEDCAPYVAVTKGQSCSQFSSCPAVAKVTKSYELKNQSDLQIQKEILRNGMIVVDWHQPPSAHAYNGGIFKTDSDSFMDIGSIVPNHAAVLVGWGSDKDTKYWILRNSFGQDWGNKGDMLVERGSFGIGLSIAGFDVEMA